MRAFVRWWGAVLLVVTFGCAKRTAPPFPLDEAPPPIDGKLPLFLNVPRDAPLLAPGELMKAMMDSPTLYEIGAPEQPIPPRQALERFWPQRYALNPQPCLTLKDGKSRVVRCEMKPEAVALLEQAEPLYQQKQFREAGALARKAAEIDPDSHVVWLYLGDCAYFSRDPLAALDAYDRALVINPIDYQVHFFRGNALAAMGRTEEAKRSFARSLVLKPRNELLLGRIEKDPNFGFAPLPEVLAPPVFAWRDGETIHVRAEPGNAPWFMYAMCKAFWIGEPGHREALTGTRDRSFSMAEELECLAGLASTYERVLTEKEMPGYGERDAALDRLIQIIKAGDVRELVILELGTRVHPQLTLHLDQASRDRLEQFVLEHVFAPRVSKKKAPARGGEGQRSASRL